MKKRNVFLAALLCVALSSGGAVAVTAAAEEPTLHPSHTDGYCLLCDVASQINALPSAEAITLENAAEVTQQIHNIDRVKYGIETDAEFDEMVEYLGVEMTDTGFGVGDVTKYAEAIDAIENLGGGGWFAVQKKFDLSGELLTDTSEAVVSFELKNVDTNEATTLSLFDYTDYCATQTADGWTFTYRVPAGTYVLTEIGLEDPIIVNGNSRKFVCEEMSCDGETVLGNGITVSVADGETKQVSALNSYTSYQEIFVRDEAGNAIDSGISLTVSNSMDTQTAIWDGSVWRVDMEYEDGQTVTVDSMPDGYCDEHYELTMDSLDSGYTHYTLTLNAHTLSEFVPQTDATCTQAGIYGYTYCTRCGVYFNAENEEVEYAELVIPANGHNYGDLILQTDATCAQAGMYSHYHCDGCGKYFNAVKQEKTIEELQIPTLPHEFGEWEETKAATATEGGELTRTCANCGHAETETTETLDSTEPSFMAIGAAVSVGALLVVMLAFTAFMGDGKKSL